MGFWGFVAQRFVLSLIVLLLVSLATFTLMHAVPGDPVDAVIGERQGDKPEVRARLERRYGLDKPFVLQYGYYLKNLLTGNLGETVTTQRPVASEVRKVLPATIELTIGALIFALGVGAPLGIVAAIRHDRWQDHVARLLALLGTAIPTFWLGLILAYLFAVRLRWLPRSGQLDIGMEPPTRVTGLISVDALLAGEMDVFWSLLRHLILPSVVLGAFSMGIIARMLRSSLLSALSSEYVRTARAKGLDGRQVVLSHAMRNALIPTVTIVGLTFSGLLAGAALTETIFSWPGLGQFAVRMALTLDYPGLLGVTLIVAVIYIVVNFFVDVLYGVLDPRIRVG